ncbi:7 transmembrane receptor [Oesophagostomum dentatum]|uniref:7 transmembrane receptor n=1 Tax=Oesophagostomum dentatum TaxID=61180 RepID=A0A0B1TT29_OESDE|nr:7 transmembrane receptor [Oesophagostomum dentatum]
MRADVELEVDVLAVLSSRNIFVVLAVVSQSQLRSTTDYLISSLAMADLLIIIFCLPTTLLNNILTEWQLGALFCKLSTWMNATTSCASIYTLVAVTADRYLAICHTLKYTLWEAGYTLYVIAGIWLVSGSLATPNLYGFDAVYFDYGNLTLCVCASRTNEKLQFVVVNLILAFIVPFLLISVSYTKIFYTVSNHRSLAVDAHIRDERIKLRVATMMLTVIVVFALCWLPLYVTNATIPELNTLSRFNSASKDHKTTAKGTAQFVQEIHSNEFYYFLPPEVSNIGKDIQ